jgi:hypothetical protein
MCASWALQQARHVTPQNVVMRRSLLTCDCRTAIRERYIGGRNRMIGGMLLHVVRRETRDCKNTRYPNVQSLCFGDITTVPYGADPSFKPAVISFNPDLTEIDMLAAYNCTAAFGSEAVRPSLMAIALLYKVHACLRG